MTAPLPVTVSIRAGQAIDCYLEHVAAANGLTPPALMNIVRAAAGPPGARYLTLAPTSAVIATIAALTGQAPTEVRAATIGAYRDTAVDLDGFDPADRRTHRAIAARGWLPGRHSHVCPHCLAETGTWQLPWRLPVTTVCLRHRCYLIASCPACGLPLRHQHDSALRPTGAGSACGNPVGRGPRDQCRHDLTTIPTAPAHDAGIATQERVDAALDDQTVQVLGQAAPAHAYLRDLRALTVLLLHLAGQPGASHVADWTATLVQSDPEPRRTTRWGLRPPDNPGLRSQALAAADRILAAPDVPSAAAALTPWADLTPTTVDGSLGWLADRTTMTPTLTRLVLAARAPHRRLSHRLDTDAAARIPTTRIPQVIPLALYQQHLTGLLGGSVATTRLFASLCLARSSGASSWAEASTVLGLPAEVGTRTARAASARMRVDTDELLTKLSGLRTDLPDIDYRHRESEVRILGTDVRQLARWIKEEWPAARRLSISMLVLGLWTEVAHAHPTTTPGWVHRPTSGDMARARRILPGARAPSPRALSGLAAGTGELTSFVERS